MKNETFLYVNVPLRHKKKLEYDGNKCCKIILNNKVAHNEEDD